ncbi:MAG TPA: HAD family acid phosphatase [Bdellovibrionota bacterium]|nr:HAD family acid phosphatase [Bdellovibrionota bacterium]
MAIDKRFTLEHPWVKGSQFEDLSAKEVLSRILNHNQGNKILFDLDGTLFDVSFRHRAILRAWAESHGGSFQEGKKIRRLLEEPLPYSIEEAFRIWGLEHSGEHQDHFESLYSFWEGHFFSGHYMEHDQPEEGAVEFLKTLEKEGLEVFYISGRFNHCMRDGTVDQLKKHKFPFSDNEQLILKSDFSIDDVEYKRRTALRLGDIRSTFDNEPANVSVMADTFPRDIHIFFETVCSRREAEPKQKVIRMISFM